MGTVTKKNMKVADLNIKTATAFSNAQNFKMI